MSADVDSFVEARVLLEYRSVAQRVREIMRRYAPGAREEISYGIPAWRLRRIIAVLSPTKKGITLAFSQGARFEDWYGLLEGVGKQSKNVRMKNTDDINEKALQYYIEQALKIEAEKEHS